MSAAAWPPVDPGAVAAVEAFAEWLETGERFAAELGPEAVDSALGDTLVLSFGYWGPVLPPFGPEPVDLAYADEPRYYAVPKADRPPMPAEPAPYDLDVIRTDLEADHPGQDVWTPYDAGDLIPARLAHLPRRPCTHVPARRGPFAPADLPEVLVCTHFTRTGQVQVSAKTMPRSAR